MTTATKPRHYASLWDDPRGTDNGTGYHDRHRQAIRYPAGKEAVYLDLLKAWLSYADKFPALTEYRIGEDYYAGPEWARMGQSLIQLLSTDLGSRLDMGTLDHVIRQAWINEGFSEEGE